MFSFKLLVLGVCLANIDFGHSQDDDDSAEFVGFHTASPMPFARSDMTATTIVDAEGVAKIYLIGGCIANQVCNFTVSSDCFCPNITNKCNYFTPEDNLWHDCPNAPINRYRHMAANVGGKLVVAGGRTLEDALITTIDVYDPQTGAWSTPFSWENATSDGVSFGANQDLFFIIGGYSASYESMATMSSLNITSGEWDTSLPSMKHGRGDIGLASQPGGKYYVLGGWDGLVDPTWCNASTAAEVYDIGNNTWSEEPNFMFGRGDLAVGVMGESIFAVAGETKDPTCSFSVPVPLVARFEPGYAEWKIEESIPDDLFRFVGASYNGSLKAYSRAIYLFGGQGSYDDACNCYPVQDSTLKYIPASTVHHHKSSPILSDGGIAGVVIAVIVVVGAIGVAIGIYCCAKKGYKKLDEQVEMSSNHVGLAPGDKIDFTI